MQPAFEAQPEQIGGMPGQKDEQRVDQQHGWLTLASQGIEESVQA